MKLGVIGKTGQLGKALSDVLAGRCDSWTNSVSPEGISLKTYSREEFDLSDDLEAIRKKALGLPNFDILINAAAYTHVDQAETEPKLVHDINCEAPAVIAQICKERGMPFIHISTDYVFNGQANKPYTEVDACAPLNVYGQTKLLSEHRIFSVSPDALIFRTSGVFGPWFTGFSGKMETLFSEAWRNSNATPKIIKVVDDQIMRPTYAIHLAGAILHAAVKHKRSGIGGLFHITGNGEPVSWKGLADYILNLHHPNLKKSVKILPVSSLEYGAPAARPAYSVLEMTSFENRFGIKMPDWDFALANRVAHQKLY